MNEYKFNVKGAERKALVEAMSEILRWTPVYKGAPSFAYAVENYIIDKHGTVTGEYDQTLFAALAERGYEPEASAPETPVEEAAPEIETPADPAPMESPETTAEPETDRLTIEVPVLGFTPEHIENLNKMVLAKESLLKKALGLDALPIRMGLDVLQFSWFPAEPSENADCYAQFIEALCETAKSKKRVTAKAQENFENEKFALRVWMIGLGLIGKEYGKIRKLMMANLSGDSSWRFGKPEKAAEEGVTAPETAPAEDIPADEEAAPNTAESAVEEAGSDD